MSKKDEALKLALEALESCSAGDYSTGHVIHPSFDVDAVNRAIDAVDEALAQPQEKYIYGTPLLDAMTEKAEQPAQQQEPLFWYDEEEGWLHDNYDDASSGCIPLYTFPPASKPWVGLTDAERTEIVQQRRLNVGDWNINGEGVAKAIEAKLRGKNT